MDSGKILPAIKVLLRSQASVNKSADKNSHQNRDQGREQKKKKPSQAEALKALEILKADENFRKKMSEKNIRLHKEGKFMNVYGSNNKSSKVELSLKPVLEPLGYVSTQDKQYFIGSPKIGVKIPDYVNSKERKIVEVWGTYWHKGEDPQELIDWYKNQGWDCTVVWENEVADFAVNMGGA